MSSDVAIHVRGLSKSYALYDSPAQRMWETLGWRRTADRREHRALEGIGFDVRRGESVGVLGLNGSGKSTLLQIVCGTLEATAGSVKVNGRVAALLELGAGFNPEFTGVENVFLNGSVLGLSRQQVDDRLADILAFADIGEYVHQPVRTYSSGMYVRLAFAVAIHVDPDILIVDEALSVGDEAFQRKCLARVEALKSRGTTVLFVSHGASTVVELCSRALWLDRGRLLADGDSRRVVAAYQKYTHATLPAREAMRNLLLEGGLDDLPVPEPDVPALGEAGLPGDMESGDEADFDATLVAVETERYERRGARIENPRIETPAGRRVNVLTTGHRYVYAYEVVIESALHGVRFGMLIRNMNGVDLGGWASALPSGALPIVSAGQRISVRFNFQCRFNEGVFFFNAGALATGDDGEHYVDRRIDVLMIRIAPKPEGVASTGMVDIDARVTLDVASACD